MNVRSINKKQQILNATLKLIAEHGLHNTPMSVIRKESGVSTGTIYHYFPSKEELINYLYVDIKKEMGETVYKGMDEVQGFKDKFIYLWRKMYNYFIENSLKLSFMEQCANSPQITKESKEAGEMYHAPIVDLIMKGMEEGIIRKTDLKLELYLIYSSIVNTAKLHITGELEIAEKLRKYAEEFTWKGITA